MSLKTLSLALATLVGCSTGEAVELGNTPVVELVRVEREVRPIMNEEHIVARFQLVNASDAPIAFRGVNGVDPIYRHRYSVDGEWVEGEPLWWGCGTGLDEGVLAIGGVAEFEVWVERPDLPLEVGVGYWDSSLDEIPDWDAWSWIWAEPVVVDDVR